MFGLITPPLISVLAALALGGSLDHWSQARLRWWPLALLALGLQVLLYVPPMNSWGPVVAVGAAGGMITTAIVLMIVLRNATGPTRAACGLAACGIALNLAVIGANGGWMPRADELSPRPIQRGDLATTVSNTAPMGENSRLAWLGDSIPQPAWLPLANVVSPGDMLLSLGAAWWAFVVTRGRLGRPARTAHA